MAARTDGGRGTVVSEDGIINRKGAVDQHVLKEFIMESEQDLDVGLEAEMADDNDDADADDDQDARARIGAMAPGFFKSMKRTASAKMLNDVFSVDGAKKSSGMCSRSHPMSTPERSGSSCSHGLASSGIDAAPGSTSPLRRGAAGACALGSPRRTRRRPAARRAAPPLPPPR